MTKRSEDGIEESRLELVIEGFRGTDSFRSGVGWVGGSIHSHYSHVGHVAFQKRDSARARRSMFLDFMVSTTARS